MNVVVFVGPTLSVDEARAVLDADFRPPAQQGDVLRAVTDSAQAVGLIDGYFQHCPSVWHKELLYAMSRGITCFGSASMGALRAAELSPFGMVGVGAVFDAFASGALSDDDEVAVMHPEDDFDPRHSTVALVNIRATLDRAVAEGVISQRVCDVATKFAKSLPYHERDLRFMSAPAFPVRLVPPEVAGRLSDWVQTGFVDVKRQDALMMLRLMRQCVEAGLPKPDHRWTFHDTSIWRQGSASDGRE